MAYEKRLRRKVVDVAHCGGQEITTPAIRCANMTPMIDIGVLDKRINDSLDLLRDNYRLSPDGGGGWYHELGSPPGFTATAVGLLAFTESGRRFDNLGAALEFLRRGQVASPDRLVDGGWPTNSSKGRPVVEATAWIGRFLGLARCTLTEGAPDAGRAYRWLAENQNDDGGWGSVRDAESRVWLTCLALRAIAALDPYSSRIEKGIGWLMANRESRDSAWGETRRGPATVTHTAFALLTLHETGHGANDDRLPRAYDFLRTGLADPGQGDRHTWIETYFVAPGRPPSDRFNLWHYGLPVALSALLHDPRGTPADLVSDAFATIVRSDVEDRPWPGYPGRSGTSLWSVWWCLEALLDLRRHSDVRPGDLLVWLPQAVVLKRAAARDRPLGAIIPHRRIHIGRLVARHWTALLLAVVTVLSLAGRAAGALAWKDVWLSLLFPTLLLVVQEGINRRLRPSR